MTSSSSRVELKFQLLLSTSRAPFTWIARSSLLPFSPAPPLPLSFLPALTMAAPTTQYACSSRPSRISGAGKLTDYVHLQTAPSRPWDSSLLPLRTIPSPRSKSESPSPTRHLARAFSTSRSVVGMLEDGSVAHVALQCAPEARDRRKSSHEHGARWKELRAVAGVWEGYNGGAGYRRKGCRFLGSDQSCLPLLRGHRRAVQAHRHPAPEQELETELRFSPTGPRELSRCTVTRLMDATSLPLPRPGSSLLLFHSTSSADPPSPPVVW